MNTKRIEEIQKETAYPDSISVQQALLKVWNECEQEKAVKNNAVLPHVSEPLLWKDILDDFYVEHDKQISNGEYKGRMLLVFRDWLEKNFEVPKRNVR